MQETLLITISRLELSQLIKESVKEQLYESQTQQSTSSILNLEEASDYLKIPINTLYSFTSKRKIPFSKMGRALRFNKDELDAWLKENRQKTKKEILSES